jgi:phosphatidylglycerophosphatase A
MSDDPQNVVKDGSGRARDRAAVTPMAPTMQNSAASSPAPLWATLTATFFYIGKLKPGPGTWGSAATVIVWYGLTRLIPLHTQTLAAVLLSIVIVAIGIPAATRVARAYQRKDPQFVVIDEVAGQLIALIAIPITWKSLLAGFILFRGFDILKPPPVRQLERLPEGTGIVLDDVGAGIFALIVMQLLLHFGFLP